MFDHIGDVDLVSLQTGFTQQLFQEAPGRPNEGAALLVFIETRRLAHEHNLRAHGAFTGNRLVGHRVQLAPCTYSNLLFQSFESRGSFRHQRLLAASISRLRRLAIVTPLPAVVPAETAFAAWRPVAAPVIAIAAVSSAPRTTTRTAIPSSVAAAARALRARGRFLSSFRIHERPMRQVDAAHGVDTGHLDLELIAQVDHV